MQKMEKEYLKEYGDIPKDKIERMGYLMKDMNLSRCKGNVYDLVLRNIHIPWKKISYTIYLLPKATPRPRSGRNGIFYVKGAKDNKKFFEDFVKNKDIHLITTPTKFYCRSYLPIPKSMNPIEKVVAELGFIYPISKPDWDNLGKAYCDMIQGLLLYDDSLVIKGVSEKYYSIKPRIEIDIYYMEDYDSSFNKSKIIKKGVD